jgi:hypothetical protein
MKRITKILALLAAGCLTLPSAAFAQGIQVLKDEWVATSNGISKIVIDDVTGEETLSTPTGSGSSFTAIALEDVGAASLANPGRNVIAIEELDRNDPKPLLRFVNGDGEAVPLFNASDPPTEFRFITSVAVSTQGNILFSGYSKRKRRFELWNFDPAQPVSTSDPSNPREVIDGSPQLTDSVYISSSDLPEGIDLDKIPGAGLLGVTDRQVLFIPEGIDPAATPTIVVDVRDLSVRNNTKILSAALVRNTTYLALALSTRTVMTYDLAQQEELSPLETAIGTSIDDSSPENVAGCGDDRDQLFRIRSLSSGAGGAINVVTDNACQLVHRHTMNSDGGTVSVDPRFATGTDLLALAVGEGTQVICEPAVIENGEIVPCPITRGYEAAFNNTEPSVLLSRKVPNLCDPRVTSANCGEEFVAENDGSLEINPQLPQDIRDALAAANVKIYLPPNLFSASSSGRFGALFVKADEVTRTLAHTAYLDLAEISADEDALPILEVRVVGDPEYPVPENPSLEQLLNNDIVAYAPDNPLEPTVGRVDNVLQARFEAASITIGRKNPVRTVPRGYSVILYGLMHDFYDPSGRLPSEEEPGGGIPEDFFTTATPAEVGSAQVCVTTLDDSSESYTTANDPRQYFMNLAACMFSDLKWLATSIDPVHPSPAVAALADPNSRLLFASQLSNLEDKLIKALNEAVPAAGPNAGDTNMQSVYSQLGNFEQLVQDTEFAAIIFKNDIFSRIQVLRFTLINRVEPSIGLAQPLPVQ